MEDRGLGMREGQGCSWTKSSLVSDFLQSIVSGANGEQGKGAAHEAPRAAHETALGPCYKNEMKAQYE
jgi:hypothetical protein